jgi:hypothetical protein
MAATTLVLPLVLLGCSSAQLGHSGSQSTELTSATPAGEVPTAARTSDAVALVTAEGHFPERSDGVNVCPYNYIVGLLIADPGYGTAARDEHGVHPLIWPVGYTARRLAGGEVEVLNRNGAVVATTGRRYEFWAPTWGGDGEPVEAGACVSVYPEGEIQTPLPT